MTVFKIVTSPPTNRKFTTLRVFDGPDADHLGLSGTLTLEHDVAEEFLALMPHAVIIERRR